MFLAACVEVIIKEGLTVEHGIVGSQGDQHQCELDLLHKLFQYEIRSRPEAFVIAFAVDLNDLFLAVSVTSRWKISPRRVDVVAVQHTVWPENFERPTLHFKLRRIDRLRQTFPTKGWTLT